MHNYLMVAYNNTTIIQQLLLLLLDTIIQAISFMYTVHGIY